MKKIASVVVTLVLFGGSALALTACGGKNEPAAAVPSSETVPVAATTAADTSAAVTDESTAADTTEAVTEAATAASTSETAVSTTAAVTETTAKTTAKTTAPKTTKKATTTTKPAPKAPSSKEEIVKLYNSALNGVNSAKAGYTKTRTTTINSLDGGALMKLSVVKDAVGDFFGKGTNTFTNKKGKTDYLGKASLKASDISSASCTEKNGKYTVTLTLKNGTGSASSSGVTDSSPLRKSGLFVGEGNNADFDYKSAENVYTAINGTDGASIKAASISTSDAKITCAIDVGTGRMESFKISFNFSADLNTVKYSIASIKQGAGTGSTTVSIPSFNY